MASLLELLVEIVAQLFGDVIIDTITRSTNRVVRMLGYCVFCAICAILFGALSLALFREHFISSHGLRIVTLCVLPVANGLLMSQVGRYYLQNGNERSAYEYFVPAFVFSAVFGAVRFFGAV